MAWVEGMTGHHGIGSTGPQQESVGGDMARARSRIGGKAGGGSLYPLDRMARLWHARARSFYVGAAAGVRRQKERGAFAPLSTWPCG